MLGRESLFLAPGVFKMRRERLVGLAHVAYHCLHFLPNVELHFVRVVLRCRTRVGLELVLQLQLVLQVLDLQQSDAVRPWQVKKTRVCVRVCVCV